MSKTALKKIKNKSLNIISKALKIITLVLLMIYVLQSEVFAETFTPEQQGAKTFGEDPFSIEYSVGNICINDQHWVYDGFEKVDVNWGFLSGPGILVKNTQKQSLGYIDHYNGAKYKNEYYDIREYIWLSNHTGSYGYIMIDDGQMAAMCDSSAIDAINNYMVREIHFYKSGTLNSQNPIEVQWKGIAQFRDCDGEKGVSIDNLNAVYLSNNTWITKRDSNTWRGTADNTNDDTNDAETTVWAEIYGQPDDPLVITYYGSIIHGATINFEGTTYTGKLTYNSNNYNKETTEQIISLGYDITVSENMFDTIEGLEFVGWNTKADGTGTNYAPNQVTQFNSATTLYAMWKVSDEFPNTQKVTIDMTFAQAGGGVECNHVWEVKHGTLDQSGNPVAQTGKTTHHWEQCWKCGTIINLEQHTMKNTTDAENTCSLGTPPLIAKCTGLDGRCNYTEEIPKLKHESYTLEKPDNAWVWGYHIQHRCKRCNVEMEPTTQWCRDANGNKLGCGTAGTCAICGFTYDGRHLALTTEDNYWNVPGVDGNFAGDTQPTKTLKLICFTCKKEFGHVDFTMHRDGNTEGRNYTVDYNIQLEPGVNIAINFKEGQFDSTNGDHGHWNYSSGNLITSGVRDYDITINGTKVNPLSDIKNISGYNNKMQIRVNSYPNSTAQYLYQFLWLCNNGGWSIDGQSQAASVCFRHHVPNELGRPIYLDHKTTDERVPNVPANQLNGTAGWSTKQSITVSFADLITSDNNALNNVWVSLKDKDGKTLYDWVPGNRSSYNSQYPQNKYTSTFDIVAEIKGTQTLTAEAHDATWNTQQTQIQVQNIDTLAPQPANEFVTSQEWQRTKDFSYLFTDKGIGHIQVSFNNDSNEYGDAQDVYRFANTTDWENYSRDYLLTGDVTGAAGVTIYAKDLLGNAASYRATVYNLDNTKPTINKCEVQYQMQNGKVINQLQIVDQNDFCQKIQQEGSGIAGYAIVEVNGDKNTVPSIPQTPDEQQFVSQNTFNIVESAWYFVYAIDGVQWISDPYPIYVECIEQQDGHELIQTVDAQAAEGKGGINLNCQFITSENAISKIWRANADSLSYTQIIEDPSEWVSVNVNSTSNISQDSLANDFSAPNPVSQVTYQNSESDANMVVQVTRPKDNGTWYTHIAQQFLVGHEAYQFSEDNDYVNMTNYTQLEVLTGVKGYYYFVDDKEDQTIVKEGSLIKSQTGEEYDQSSGSNIVNKDVIYNKTLHIEYIRDIIGGLEQVIVDQDCATDEVINFNIDQNQIKEDYDFKIFRVYLHIAAYDNAGNLSETTTVPIKLTYITYKSNGSGEADVIQDMTIGESVELLGDIFDKDNSRLTGWNTKPDGTGTHYDSNKEYIFNDQITLYAEWDKISNLVIDPNGGSWTDSGAVTVKPNTDQSKVDQSPTGNTYDQPHSFKLGEDDTKQIKDPMKEGYNFEGWIIESVE